MVSGYGASWKSKVSNGSYAKFQTGTLLSRMSRTIFSIKISVLYNDKWSWERNGNIAAYPDMNAKNWLKARNLSKNMSLLKKIALWLAIISIGESGHKSLAKWFDNSNKRWMSDIKNCLTRSKKLSNFFIPKKSESKLYNLFKEIYWLGNLDSNQDWRSQSPQFYR